MDFSDVGVKHLVDFTDQIIIKHTLDITPETIKVVKEVRNVALALIVAWSVVSIVNSRRSSAR
jgi:hypothetical protein